MRRVSLILLGQALQVRVGLHSSPVTYAVLKRVCKVCLGTYRAHESGQIRKNLLRISQVGPLNLGLRSLIRQSQVFVLVSSRRYSSLASQGSLGLGAIDLSRLKATTTKATIPLARILPDSWLPLALWSYGPIIRAKELFNDNSLRFPSTYASETLNHTGCSGCLDV